MKTHPHRTSLLALAVASLLAAPLAFAQTDTSTTDTSTRSTSSTEAQTTPTSTMEQSTTTNEATTSNDASAATTAGDAAKKNWSDVDTDKDGNLSKTEAAVVPALGQVFDQADANADGSLTADEYKSYVAKAQQENATTGDSDQ